jgi:hypothetical protein
MSAGTFSSPQTARVASQSSPATPSALQHSTPLGPPGGRTPHPGGNAQPGIKQEKQDWKAWASSITSGRISALIAIVSLGVAVYLWFKPSPLSLWIANRTGQQSCVNDKNLGIRLTEYCEQILSHPTTAPPVKRDVSGTRWTAVMILDWAFDGGSVKPMILGFLIWAFINVIWPLGPYWRTDIVLHLMLVLFALQTLWRGSVTSLLHPWQCLVAAVLWLARVLLTSMIILLIYTCAAFLRVKWKKNRERKIRSDRFVESAYYSIVQSRLRKERAVAGQQGHTSSGTGDVGQSTGVSSSADIKVGQV